MSDPTIDLKSAVDDLAQRSLARVADLDRRQERLQKWEAEAQAKRARIEAETTELANRLATVLEAEAALAAKTKAAAGDFVDLAAARAAAEAVRADYTARLAKLKETIR